MEVNVAGQKIVMAHFPFAIWNRYHHGAWNLYGHCHGSYTAVGKQMDVGYDTNDIPDWTPGLIPFDVIKRVMDSREFVRRDGHGDRVGDPDR